MWTLFRCFLMYVVLSVIFAFVGPQITLAQNAQTDKPANATGESAGQQPGDESETQTAIFAGGCFWCMESAFDKVKECSQQHQDIAVEKPRIHPTNLLSMAIQVTTRH